MTDSERTLHGDDEIDLNDDDDDMDSSVGVSSSQSGLPPTTEVNHDISNDYTKNHLGDNHLQSDDTSMQDQTKPYGEDSTQIRQPTVRMIYELPTLKFIHSIIKIAEKPQD